MALSRSALADLAGVSANTVARMEEGKPVQIELTQAVGAVLRIDIQVQMGRRTYGS